MTAFGSAYGGVRERVGELVLSLPPEDLEKRVPACPDWTIKDLVSHMTGIAADMIAGNVAEAGQDDWTNAQIESRSDRSIQEIVDEWKEVGTQLEAALEHLHPAVGAMTVGDVVTHEHDARQAVGRPGARDSDAAAIGLDNYVRRFGRRIRENGLPTLEVKTESRTLRAGKEEPVGSVGGTEFELLRALTGRRTKDQIKALDWTVDSEPYLDVFSSYTVPDQPFDE
jgi:uncharacterized protein (TIGR03083 family)